MHRVLQAQIQLLMEQRLLLPEVEAIALLLVRTAQIVVEQEDRLQPVRQVVPHFQVVMEVQEVLVDPASTEEVAEAALQVQLEMVDPGLVTVVIMVGMVEQQELEHQAEQQAELGVTTILMEIMEIPQDQEEVAPVMMPAYPVQERMEK